MGEVLAHYFIVKGYFYGKKLWGKLIDVDLLKASAILAYINIILYIAYTYYYINLECFITVRIEKKKYYAIILKKLIGGIILLIISSFLIPYYSVDLFFLIILDKLSLLIVFFLILITCLKYKKTDGIVLCYFIMVLLRYMKTFF